MHTWPVGQRLRQWRSWDPRLLWLAVVDVLATLLLANFGLTGHHSAAALAWTALGWVAIVAVITPALVRMWHRNHT
jgi:hypothetical protein